MKKLWKQAVALFCVLALMVGLVPSALAYGNASSWAREELDKMESMGLIPQELLDKEDLRGAITRLEMCAAAVLSYETLTDQVIVITEEKPFTDTDDPIVAKAYAAGLVNGYTDGTFKPEGILTRQEFFCFVYQFMLAAGWQAEDRFYDDLTMFTDCDTVADWVREAAQVVVGTGIVRGTGKALSPRTQATCEQSLIMFYRAYLILDAMGEPGSTPPYCPDEPGQLPFEEKYPNMANWAKEELKPMDSAGLIPTILEGRDMSTSITRKEACYVATTAFFSLQPEFVPENMASPFSDVDDTIITTAYYLGIIKGYPDGTFKPEEPITREQFFSIIGNFLMVVGFNRTDDTTADLSVFSDSDMIQNYALPATRLLYSMGIVKGSGGKLSPKAQTQCQEALAMFYRTYLYFEDWVNNMENEGSSDRPVADALVEFALQFEGYEYVYGAEDPEDGFDCSGLVYYVYRHFGYKIGRTATNQWNYEDSREISKDELLPGDLVFFHEGNPNKITHVGIYIGGSLFIHAANSKRGVVIDSVDDDYYAKNYYGSRRIIE